MHKAWDNTTLGTLRIDRSRLVVEVNSVRRRRRIEREIAKCLGSAATFVDVATTDVAKALEQRRESGSQTSARLPAPTAPPRTTELQAIELEVARRHWDAWLDTRIPALGNRSPRQAAKTALGRERLEALLADYAQKRTSDRQALDPDVVELKRKLGLG
jgi:hypothetical protein